MGEFLRLYNLELTNFLSYKSLELDFCKLSKISVVVGSNGAGKSSILDAVTYALFGEPLRSISVDDLVNFNEKRCEVKLSLKNTDGSIFLIARGRDKNKQVSFLSLSLDEVDCTQSSLKESQRYLENILGLDFRTYSNSILFGQNSVSEFVEGTDKDRKQILGTVFKFDQLDKCLELVKEQLSPVVLDIDLVGSKIQLLRGQLLELPGNQSKLAFLNIKLGEEEKVLKGVAESIQKSKYLLLEMENSRAELVRLKKCEDQINKDIFSYQQNLFNQKSAIISKLKQDIQNIRGRKKILEETKAAFINLKNSLETLPDTTPEIVRLSSEVSKLETQLTQVSTEIMRLNSEVLKLEKMLTHVSTSPIVETGEKKCPYCFSDLSSESLNSLISSFNTSIREFKVAVQENEASKIKMASMYTNLKMELDRAKSLSNQRQDVERKLSLCTYSEDEYQNLVTNLIVLEAELVKVSSEESPLEDSFIISKKQELKTCLDSQLSINFKESVYRDISNQLLVLEKRESEVVQEVTRIRGDISSITGVIEYLQNLEKDIEKYKTQLDGLEKEKMVLDYCISIFGKGGVKNYFLKNIIPLLEDRINYYLSILSDSKISVLLNVQSVTKAGELSDKLELNIVMGGRTLSVNSYSGGEKKRLGIACRLAISEVIKNYFGVSLDFLFFDEASSDLDVSGYDSFIKILSTLQASVSNILIISHNPELSEKIGGVLNVSASDAGSVLTA